MTTEDIYIPTGSITLDKITSDPQIRLGLQGPPGSGKTWAAVTFPNTVVLNFDRGLGAHVGRSDIVEVPFWNPSFVDSIVKRAGVVNPPNRKDALLKWLHTEGMKLKPTQTLVVDSNTQLNAAFHSEYSINPVITKSGKIDDFGEWNFKVVYFAEIMDKLKSLQCHVVYIAHETNDRDRTGELNGMVRPLMTGQFGDQLASHFTDWYRCLAVTKPLPEKLEDFKKVFGPESTELINSTPTNCGSVYVWQTQSDSLVKHAKTSLVSAPKFVLANYKSFSKYNRKTTT